MDLVAHEWMGDCIYCCWWCISPIQMTNPCSINTGGGGITAPTIPPVCSCSQSSEQNHVQCTACKHVAPYMQILEGRLTDEGRENWKSPIKLCHRLLVHSILCWISPDTILELYTIFIALASVNFLKGVKEKNWFPHFMSSFYLYVQFLSLCPASCRLAVTSQHPEGVSDHSKTVAMFAKVCCFMIICLASLCLPWIWHSEVA